MIKNFDEIDNDLYRSGWKALAKLIVLLVLIGVGVWAGCL